MYRLASACLGAAFFQLLHFSQEMQSIHAAWGWTISVPDDGGFSCVEGTTIGGGPSDNFVCTVQADTGMTCDIANISVMCYKTATPNATFSPPDGQCLTVGHNPDNETINDKDSELEWSQVPSCVASNDSEINGTSTTEADGTSTTEADGSSTSEADTEINDTSTTEAVSSTTEADGTSTELTNVASGAMTKASMGAAFAIILLLWG